MTDWEKNRHALDSLRLTKLAIDQARTAMLIASKACGVNHKLIDYASKFESEIDCLIDGLVVHVK
jgi:hypothetical protein